MKYHRPENLAEAQKLLNIAHPLLVHPRMPVEPYAQTEAVIDLSKLNLNYIKHEGDLVQIGLTTSLQDLADSQVLRTLARGILPEAARYTAHLGLRQVSTVGGVILNPLSAVDIMLALLALGFVPQHASPEISFTVSSSARASLQRIVRTPMDAPIVAAYAVKDGNTVRVAVGGVGIVPTLIDPQKPLENLSPVSDFRASIEYQREMTGVLVKRVMKELKIND